ncbi:MAG: NUDIX hydrolase, partial [Clostridiaceae bacterium]|nr:NUDIX hydrolase [Clostridiaceae bacterium]
MTKSFDAYEKISVATDVVILTSDEVETNNPRMSAPKGLKVLLVKRDEEPFNGEWSLPGGFVDVNVGIEQAARNKVAQKTGVENLYMEQLYTYGNELDRDPRGRVISIAYLALLNKENIQQNTDSNTKESQWFWVMIKNGQLLYSTDGKGYYLIDNLKIAFDHKKILQDALERLKNKVLYTDVAFQLLPELFTMRELQDIFELLHGKTIYSFRRFIESKV